MTEDDHEQYRERDDVTRGRGAPDPDGVAEPGQDHEGEHSVGGLDVFEGGELVKPATDGGERDVASEQLTLDEIYSE